LALVVKEDKGSFQVIFIINAGGQIRGVGVVLQTANNDWSPFKRNCPPTARHFLHVTSRIGPDGVAQGRWSRNDCWNERAIGVLHESRKGDLCIKFIVGSDTLIRFREGVFPAIL